MSSNSGNLNKITDHLFRHHAGKMVAVLTKIFGTQNLDVAQDVVQDTLLLALEVWIDKGIPDNPTAWLYRVAKNKAIDIIRRNKHSLQFDFSDTEELFPAQLASLLTADEDIWEEELVKDDMLRMMFACCHPGISEYTRITLILKTLCGFSTAEIAKSFLTTEDTVSKRLYRGKEFFMDNKIKLTIPSVHKLKERVDAVLNAIYLLFNGGYNSSHSEQLIRTDLMEEAMRLCQLLTENSYTQYPETFALMALMCFHTSRSAGRLTTDGEIILLPHQDRTTWDRKLIALGNEYMNRAAFGPSISKYHLEAAIAFEHCIADSFDKTDWRRILEYYDGLCKTFPSPISELNRAVVILQVSGATAALRTVESIPDKKKLESFYIYHSLLGEIYTRLHEPHKAGKYFETAISLTPSETERKVLRSKLNALMN